MIDLNEIEVAARKPWYCRSKQEDNLLRPEILVELITRLREAERDAARYRHIKSVCEVIECADGKYLDVLDGQDLDAMVDYCIEAMKENGDE